MKKINFIFKNADAKTRILGIVALALAALAILSVIISANAAINGEMTNMPILKLVLSDDEIDDFNDKCKDLRRSLKDAIEDDDDDTLDRIKDEYNMSAKKLLKCLDPVSLNSVKILAARQDKATYSILSIIILAIWAYAFILILFVALSALFMNKGFFITSAVLSALFFFIFVGVVWFFVFLALCIAYSILVSKVHDAYVVYKNAPVAPVDNQPAV